MATWKKILHFHMDSHEEENYYAHSGYENINLTNLSALGRIKNLFLATYKKAISLGLILFSDLG